MRFGCALILSIAAEVPGIPGPSLVTMSGSVRLNTNNVSEVIERKKTVNQMQKSGG